MSKPWSEIKKLTLRQLEMARHVFRNPDINNTNLGKEFSLSRNWAQHTRNSIPFKERLASLEKQVTEATVNKLATREARKELADELGQDHAIHVLMSTPKDPGEKRIKADIAKDAMSRMDSKIDPKDPESGTTIYIDKLQQINIDEAPIDKLRELLMKVTAEEI